MQNKIIGFYIFTLLMTFTICINSFGVEYNCCNNDYKEEHIYYLLRDTYSYSRPDDKSDKSENLYINNEIKLYWLNEDWWYYKSDIGDYLYVRTMDITRNMFNYKDFDISNSGHKRFKSYMPYTVIKKCKQYEIQSKYAYTGNYGIRMVKDRYCIALGTAFGIECGQYVDLILEDGTTIKAILSDIKADAHTTKGNIVTRVNGCATEFIVDKKSLVHDAKIMGDISYCNPDWKQKVKIIRIYDYNILEN